MSTDRFTKEEIEQLEALAESAREDAEKFESGELGLDDKYVKQVPAKASIHIKAFPVSLRDRLKELAAKKHLSYSSYIKMVLQEHVDAQE